MLELTAPAMLLAGIATSPHCAAMCAPLHALSARSRGGSMPMLNAGRVLGYATLGAIAGAGGARAMSWLPAAGVIVAAQFAAAAVLTCAGFALLQHRSPKCAHQYCPRSRSRVPVVVRGLAWAGMPCGFLYATLLLAMLSGSALQGALLLFAFGVGTLPAAIAGSTLLLRLRRGSGNLQRGAGAALLLAGIAAAALAWLHPVGGFWCVTG